MGYQLFTFLFLFSFYNISLIKEEPDHSYSLGKRHILPVEVRETSGLIKYNGLVWTFNDSGGKPYIYGLNLANDSIEQTITLKNAINKDWEEISQDNSFIYIGDFGNNQGTRDSLVIYKISKTSIPAKGNAGVSAEAIIFSYPGYHKVSLPMGFSPYDCEAFVVTNDSIYLFTKNWTNGTSAVYALPKVKGKYTAKKITTLKTQGLITGAAYQNNQLLLIGYSSFIPFINKYSVNAITKVNDKLATRYNLEDIATYQTEGICFDGDKILISSEATRSPAQIMEIVLK